MKDSESVRDSRALSFRYIFSQRKKAQNFWFEFFYFFSSFVVWVGVRRGWRPNSITVAGSFLNLLGGVFYFFGAWALESSCLAVSALIFTCAHVLDCADGHLAYVSNQRSAVGAWLDSSLDVVKLALVTSCLVDCMMRTADDSGCGFARVGGLCAFGSLANYAVSLAAASHRKALDGYAANQLDEMFSSDTVAGRCKRFLLSHSREYGNVLLAFFCFAVDARLAFALVAILGLAHFALALNRIRVFARLLGTQVR